MADKKEKVLIVGGGFGGVKAAHNLAKNKNFEVTLISTDDELRYYPTLYLTATGGSRSNSSIPYSTIFEGLKLNIVRDEAVSLDRKSKVVTTQSGASFGYDSLILALGVVTNYFGIPGLQEFSFSIKTQDEAARFKEHLHKQLADEKKPDLNYIIVGAGPTGIELAGALPAYLKKIMKNHDLTERKIHIDLIEAGPKLLPMMPSSTSRRVEKQLKTLGVKLYLNSKVEGEDIDGLTVSGKPIRSHTVVWTAGVTNNPFFSTNGFAIMGRGKVGVDAYLQTELDIYVIGDNANTPFSGLAQTALYDGEFVAENLIRKVENKTLKNYNPKKPISVIPSGPHWAAVVWGKKHFNGYMGYLVREAADLAGFHDLEPWPKATKQFFTKYESQDNCNVCTLSMSKYQA
jgi:NADH dehydrogenase